MGALDDWLRLAPRPTPLTSREKWHVFLSYRSTHRPWVIQLYDILRHLGFEVFLDQYVLVPSDVLVAGLQEGLSRSRSGILVWSTATEDSKWCQRELQNLETRKIKDDDFHYVVAKLDAVELPALTADRLYIDFSDCREGPRGSGLLRLLFGIIGKPLPAAAVQLASEVDQQTADALLAVRAARLIGDHRRLMEMANGQDLCWTGGPLLSCEVADGLIKLKRYDDAVALIKEVQQRFPRSVRSKQLLGLAYARLGRLDEAQLTLGTLVAAGERDPETLGIFARTWMDRYEKTRDVLHLKASRDYYVQAFKGAPSDYYTGINVAAKSVFLGDIDVAREYARKVEVLVGTEPTTNDYWKTATAAEVQLILGGYREAAKLYDAALPMAPNERGSHESTWKQAKRLMENLEISSEDRAQIARVFAHLGN